MPPGTRVGLVPTLAEALLLAGLAIAAAIPVASRWPEPIAASALAIGQLSIAGWGLARLRRSRTPVRSEVAGPLTAAAMLPLLLLGIGTALTIFFIVLSLPMLGLSAPSFLRSLYLIGGLAPRRVDGLAPGVLGAGLAASSALLVRLRFDAPSGFGGSGDWFLPLVLASWGSVALVAAAACWLEADSARRAPRDRQVFGVRQDAPSYRLGWAQGEVGSDGRADG